MDVQGIDDPHHINHINQKVQVAHIGDKGRESLEIIWSYHTSTSDAPVFTCKTMVNKGANKERDRPTISWNPWILS